MIIVAAIPKFVWPPKGITDRLSAISVERLSLCTVIMFGAMCLLGVVAVPGPVWVDIFLIVVAAILVFFACLPAAKRLWDIRMRD